MDPQECEETKKFQYRKRYKGACNLRQCALRRNEYMSFQYRKRYKGACNVEE